MKPAQLLIGVAFIFALRPGAARGQSTCTATQPACASSTNCTFCARADAEIDTLDANNCANNNGTVNFMRVGVDCSKSPCVTYRGLMQFDLASIPHISTITSVTLRLRVNSMIDGGGTSDIKIMRALQPFWTENEVIWEVYKCPGGDTTQFPWCAVGGDFDAQTNVVTWTAALGTNQLTNTTHPKLLTLAQAAVDSRGGKLHLLFKAGN